MAQVPKNLYEAVTLRARVLRQGDIVCYIVDGGGAMVMASQDFLQAQKWATSKPFSGNALTDRARFLEQIPALVSRPGSMLPTRGNDRQVERLAIAMRQAGYDLGEWLLPPELKRPPLPSVEPPKKAQEGGA
jgi:hypothetical protein